MAGQQTQFTFPGDDQVDVEPARPIPRLSEQLGGPVRPDACQGCGSPCDLKRWQEHDDRDQPERIVIVLCARCSKRLIGPHPRLYRELDRNEPWPGAMAICLRCRFREGLWCANPAAKANGGAGVKLRISRPQRMHVLRSPRRLSGWLTYWPSPASDCEQREIHRVVGEGR